MRGQTGDASQRSTDPTRLAGQSPSPNAQDNASDFAGEVEQPMSPKRRPATGNPQRGESALEEKFVRYRTVYPDRSIVAFRYQQPSERQHQIVSATNANVVVRDDDDYIKEEVDPQSPLTFDTH